jgi:hypothetical protein
MLSVPGCSDGGPTSYPVTGSVVFDGEPVAKGSISFIPADPAHRTSSTAIAEGTYSLRLPAGSHKVEIMATKDNGPFDPAMGQAPQKQYIPDKYNVESKLSEEIKPDGENRFDFDLKP